MKTAIKFAGVVLLIIFLAVGGVVGGSFVNYSMTEALVVEDTNFEWVIPSDDASVQEGKRIATIKGCYDCHGADLGGKTFVEDPAVGIYHGSNLTAGEGGIGKSYKDVDWIRAIRYGRGPSKRYLRFMPSQEFYSMSNEDIGKLIAYLKSIPPVDRPARTIEVGPVAKVFYLVGNMPLLFSGKLVDTSVTPPERVEASESSEYGKYLAASCVGCHGQNFAGGTIPGVPPSWPKAANLTMKGNLANWTFDQFKSTLKTGQTPEGKVMSPQFMPWTSTAAMTDVELTALFNFLKSLPPVE